MDDGAGSTTGPGETTNAPARWSNWSGRLRARPTEVIPVASEEDVRRTILRAGREGLVVRAQGATHSHAPLVPTDGLIVDCGGLDGIVGVHRDCSQVSVRSGTRIAALGEPLRAAGLALMNQGDIDRQAIGGAIATGTHGTGPTLQNFSASVRGLRIVLASGDVVDCDASKEPELFEAARLSLGALGIVTELSLEVRDAYKLAERMWLEDLDAVLDRLDELTSATRHFEFFWLPGKTKTACKALAVTDADPVHPIGEEGSRIGWSHEVLANDRPDKHSELEYSIPARSGPACLRALRELVQRRFPSLAWPIEYRTLAADDLWISTASGRPTVTISLHQGIDEDDEPLFRACEEVFESYGGRPHWGKVHYQSGRKLAALYPHWHDWWRVRDAHDPNDLFLNDLLRSWREG